MSNAFIEITKYKKHFDTQIRKHALSDTDS